MDEPANPIIREIRARLWKYNRNWLSFVCGGPGTGKSYLALRLACLIDPEFKISNVVFGCEEFMDLLTNGTLKKGDVIVFDDAGVGMDSQTWYEFEQKAVKYVFETFRTDNIAVIFTSPARKYINTSVLLLFHAFIEARKIDRAALKVRTKFFRISYNNRFDKLYYKYYRFNRKKLDPVLFNLPDPELIQQYEAKRKIFSGKVKDEAVQIIQSEKNKSQYELKKKMDPVDIATEIMKQPERLKLVMFNHRGHKRASKDMIRTLYNTTDSQARAIKTILERQETFY
jgi:hypothetical protein